MTGIPKVYDICVTDGSEEHTFNVPADNVDHAKERALKVAEKRYGTSAWRVYSVNGDEEPIGS